MKPLGMVEFKNNKLMIIKAAIAIIVRIDGLNCCNTVFEFFNAKIVNTEIEAINNAKA